MLLERGNFVPCEDFELFRFMSYREYWKEVDQRSSWDTVLDRICSGLRRIDEN
jgi:hypothetical protein